jgi:hypothetical protein
VPRARCSVPSSAHFSVLCSQSLCTMLAMHRCFLEAECCAFHPCSVPRAVLLRASCGAPCSDVLVAAASCLAYHSPDCQPPHQQQWGAVAQLQVQKIDGLAKKIK